jgi:hypothetical protein
LPAFGCGQVGPSQIVDFSGTWTGALKYVSCRQFAGCFPKACLNEADFAAHTTATFTLVVRQRGDTATADLTLEEQNPYVHYRESGQLSGHAAGTLELAGTMTRTLDGRGLVEGRHVVLVSSPPADTSPRQIRGPMRRRSSDSHCTTVTEWQFEGQIPR